MVPGAWNKKSQRQAGNVRVWQCRLFGLRVPGSGFGSPGWNRTSVNPTMRWELYHLATGNKKGRLSDLFNLNLFSQPKPAQKTLYAFRLSFVM